MLTGGCLCGQVTYRIAGPVRDARSCHCSRCRKAFSAQASAYALVDPEQFHWLQGEHLLSRYATQVDFGLCFCSQCGSTLCGTFKDSVHGITLGCLNEDPEIEIGYHLYVGSKAAWEVLPSGITAYNEGLDQN